MTDYQRLIHEDCGYRWLGAGDGPVQCPACGADDPIWTFVSTVTV